MYFTCVWCNSAFLLPVNSNNYLSIQFNRLSEKIKIPYVGEDQQIQPARQELAEAAQKKVKQRH